MRIFAFQRQEPVNNGLSTTCLKHLSRFTSDGNLNDKYFIKYYLLNSFCAICTDTIKKNDNVIGLPCGHLFHNDCIEKYLEDNNTCPICKTNIEEAMNSFPEASPASALNN